MKKFRFIKRVKTKNPQYDCGIYQTKNDDEFYYGLKLIPNVEYFENELIDHTENISKFYYELLEFLPKNSHKNALISIEYKWRVPKTQETGVVNKQYFWSEKKITKEFYIGMDLEKLDLISQDKKSYKIPDEFGIFTRNWQGGSYGTKKDFFSNVSFEKETNKKQLTYVRRLTYNAFLYEDYNKNQYIHGNHETFEFLDKEFKSKFSGIIFNDCYDPQNIFFKIYKNGKLENLKGFATSDGDFCHWLYSKVYIDGVEKIMNREHYHVFPYISLSKKRINEDKFDTIVALTKSNMVEIPDIPGVSSEEYEDEFVKLEKIKYGSSKIRLFSFKFDTNFLLK